MCWACEGTAVQAWLVGLGLGRVFFAEPEPPAPSLIRPRPVPERFVAPQRWAPCCPLQSVASPGRPLHSSPSLTSLRHIGAPRQASRPGFGRDCPALPWAGCWPWQRQRWQPTSGCCRRWSLGCCRRPPRPPAGPQAGPCSWAGCSGCCRRGWWAWGRWHEWGRWSWGRAPWSAAAFLWPRPPSASVPCSPCSDASWSWPWPCTARRRVGPAALGMRVCVRVWEGGAEDGGEKEEDGEAPRHCCLDCERMQARHLLDGTCLRRHLAHWRACPTGSLPAGEPAQCPICHLSRAMPEQVDLVQGDNLSWFGFPDDTSPSSRDFLPGLAAENGKRGRGRSGPGGGGPAPGGGGGGRRDGSARPDRARPHGGPAGSEGSSALLASATSSGGVPNAVAGADPDGTVSGTDAWGMTRVIQQLLRALRAHDSAAHGDPLVPLERTTTAVPPPQALDEDYEPAMLLGLGPCGVLGRASGRRQAVTLPLGSFGSGGWAPLDVMAARSASGGSDPAPGAGAAAQHSLPGSPRPGTGSVLGSSQTRSSDRAGDAGDLDNGNDTPSQPPVSSGLWRRAGQPNAVVGPGSKCTCVKRRPLPLVPATQPSKTAPRPPPRCRQWSGLPPCTSPATPLSRTGAVSWPRPRQPPFVEDGTGTGAARLPQRTMPA